LDVEFSVMSKWPLERTMPPEINATKLDF
jgi:hypothetical protein